MCEAEDQAVTETTMETSTPEERYIVSGARIKLFTFSPQSEVTEFDEMSSADQLRYARQQRALKTGIESKIQDGAQEPCQERRHDPWKGEEPHGIGTGAASSNVTATPHTEGEGETSSGTSDVHATPGAARRSLADAAH